MLTFHEKSGPVGHKGPNFLTLKKIAYSVVRFMSRMCHAHCIAEEEDLPQDFLTCMLLLDKEMFLFADFYIV